VDRPAEDTEDEIKNEEWADDDEADEVYPRPTVTVNVVDLTQSINQSINQFNINNYLFKC